MKKRVVLWVLILGILIVALLFSLPEKLLSIITGKAVVVADNTPFENTANCNDSDGGVFSFVKGNVSYVLNNRARNVVDVCLSGGYGYGGGNLREYYCINSALKSANILCKDGCLNGSCVNITISGCSDSDATPQNRGRNYTLKGTAKKGDISNTDFCDKLCVNISP